VKPDSIYLYINYIKLRSTTNAIKLHLLIENHVTNELLSWILRTPFYKPINVVPLTLWYVLLAVGLLG
jgi:hypothetical protein